MKEMAAFQPGMDFYGDMPDSYNLIINTEHPLISKIRDDAEVKVANKLTPITKVIDDNNSKIAQIREANKNKALNDEDNKTISSLEEATKALRDDETRILSEYASKQPLIKQLIDLALLGNGLLSGEELNSFIRRSISLL